MTADRRAPDPIGQIIDELRATHPDANPMRIFPRGKDEADCAEAERRAEQRAGDLG
jgi:hypothetical protein